MANNINNFEKKRGNSKVTTIIRKCKKHLLLFILYFFIEILSFLIPEAVSTVLAWGIWGLMLLLSSISIILCLPFYMEDEHICSKIAGVIVVFGLSLIPNAFAFHLFIRGINEGLLSVPLIYVHVFPLFSLLFMIMWSAENTVHNWKLIPKIPSLPTDLISRYTAGLAAMLISMAIHHVAGFVLQVIV